jgi:tripartite-type tricarboxylate transporter receptor subunit TctC
MKRLFASLFGLSLLAGAHAQTPHVTMIVPFPAGNATDGMARKIQPLLARELGQTVIVENLAGAGGAIGVQKVLAARPDGQTILVATATESVLTPAALAAVKYQPEDLRMVGMIGTSRYVLLAGPALKVTSLKEFLALGRAKQEPRNFSFGSAGVGSMTHLAAEQFAKLSGIGATHVPYKGVPPVLTDLQGGQIDFAIVPLAGPVLPLIAQGRLHALAVAGPQPHPFAPQVPTMASIDPALEGFEAGSWVALFLPRKAPEAAVQRLNQAFNTAMRDVELRKWLEATSATILDLPRLEDLERYYTEQTTRLRKLASDHPVSAN